MEHGGEVADAAPLQHPDQQRHGEEEEEENEDGIQARPPGNLDAAEVDDNKAGEDEENENGGVAGGGGLDTNNDENFDAQEDQVNEDNNEHLQDDRLGDEDRREDVEHLEQRRHQGDADFRRDDFNNNRNEFDNKVDFPDGADTDNEDDRRVNHEEG